MTATEERTIPGHAVVVADTDGMDRLAWLSLRRAGIGGSDASAICGENRYATQMSVWLDKVGWKVDDTDSEAAEWGRRLEPVVREAVAEKTGLVIEPCSALLAHPEHEWMLANVDGFCFSPELGHGVYEGKTAGVWTGAEWDDDEVPPGYIIQGQHYLAVTGLDFVCYGVLIGGQRLAVRWVKRDEELIGSLVKLERDFWTLVTTETMPEPDGSQACTDVLSKLWDPIPEAAVVLDRADVLAVVRTRELAAADEKDAAARKDAASNQLRLWLASSEVATDADGRPLYTWKEEVSSRVDPEALRSAYPDVAAAVTVATPRRTLRISKATKTAATAAGKD